MNTTNEIKLEYSSRRPIAQAWCARSEGHITYAATREDALERHKSTLDTYTRIISSLQLCADHSLTARH